MGEEDTEYEVTELGRQVYEKLRRENPEQFEQWDLEDEADKRPIC